MVGAVASRKLKKLSIMNTELINEINKRFDHWTVTTDRLEGLILNTNSSVIGIESLTILSTICEGKYRMIIKAEDYDIIVTFFPIKESKEERFNRLKEAYDTGKLGRSEKIYFSQS
jgi:hypothetical protein